MGMLNEVKSKNKLKTAQNWLKMAENAKTPEKEVEYYTKALDAYPYNAEAWFRKGKVLEKMGDFEEAKRCFDLATEIDPGYQELVAKKQYVTVHDVNHAENPASSKSRALKDVPMAEELEEQPESLPEKKWVVEEYVKSDSVYKHPTDGESIFSGLRTKQNDVPEMSVAPKDPYLSEIPLEKAHDDETELFTEFPDEDLQQENMKSGAEIKDMSNNAISAPPSETGFWKEPSVESKEKPELKSMENTQVDSWESKIKPVKQARLKSMENTQVNPLENNTKPVKQVKLKPPEETKPKSSYTETQPAALDFENGGLQDMDIRIPMSETLKFWAVGIVAMLIAFKIMSYI
jgi:tetratricopeptide (TPR) repeat protein